MNLLIFLADTIPSLSQQALGKAISVTDDPLFLWLGGGAIAIITALTGAVTFLFKDGKTSANAQRQAEKENLQVLTSVITNLNQIDHSVQMVNLTLNTIQQNLVSMRTDLIKEISDLERSVDK